MSTHPSVPLLDVVTVPDFRPGAAVLFEARTLFFLASWLERAGEHARARFHLHLACIGEPPRSVRWLAAQCGAEISLHEPLPLDAGLTTNKLRGFEVPARGPRLLLLDSDLLVLNDLGTLPDAATPDALAAAPACRERVPGEYWEIIYDMLGLPRPTARILSVRREKKLNQPRPMYPYHNSGVLLLPRNTDLRTAWEHDIVRIRARFLAQAATDATPALRAVTASDQAGLATALHRLGCAGREVCRLPEAFHYRPAHFEAGALPFEQIRLFHAIHFLRGLTSRDEIEPCMENYLRRWRGDIRSGWRRRGRVRFLWRGLSDSRRAADFLRGLWRRHVHPALAENSREPSTSAPAP